MKEKLRILVKDERNFKQRLIISLITAFAFAFTFVFFGISDLYSTNKNVLQFSYEEIVIPLLVVSVIAFVCVLILCSIFKGLLYDVCICLVVGILIAGYIQGNFLNLSLGELTGDSIEWQNYIRHAIKNTFIWLAIPGILLAIYYLAKNIWNKIVFFIPIILIGMQMTALVASFASGGMLEPERDDRYLSVEGAYELSSKDNIIVFILDRLDTKYIDEVKEESPEFFDRLDGFTYYSNYTSLYCRTYPSVTYMLTGNLGLFDKPSDVYFEESWANSEFIPLLRENNYSTKLYMEIKFTYSDIKQLDGMIDNIGESERVFKSKLAIKKLVQLSAYRYAPHVFKPTFWLSTDEFGKFYDVNQDPKPYTTNDRGFYEDLISNGVSIEAESGKNNFSLIHLNGSHAPYRLNAKIEKVPENETSLVDQTKGSFEIVYEYMEQMKELGLYEDATIIITGDHGKSEDKEEVSDYKTTAFYLKPSGSSDTPLLESDVPGSHENFRATILEEAGIEPLGGERSILELSEDEDVVRKFYYQVDEVGSAPAHLEEFEIRGDAREFINWTKINEYPVIHAR